jgi:hypothetical protein
LGGVDPQASCQLRGFMTALGDHFNR